MRLPGLRRSTARTTLLGVAALGVLLWAAVTQVGLDVNRLLEQLLLILLTVFVIAACAAVCVLVMAFLRRRRG